MNKYRFSKFLWYNIIDIDFCACVYKAAHNVMFVLRCQQYVTRIGLLYAGIFLLDFPESNENGLGRSDQIWGSAAAVLVFL